MNQDIFNFAWFLSNEYMDDLADDDDFNKAASAYITKRDRLQAIAKKELEKKIEKSDTHLLKGKGEVDEGFILVNQIRTPDGTIIQSTHRHDCVTYVDKNECTYMVDGGLEYLRRNVVDIAPYTELSIYSTSPHEEIRKYFKRGGRGKDGFQPLTWVSLCDMSNSWVEAVITYEEKHRPTNPFLPIFRAEVVYRATHEIFIED